MNINVSMGEYMNMRSEEGAGVGWNPASILATRHSGARASEKAPCRVSVAVPGQLWLPDSVVFAAPEATREFFFKYAEMDAHLKQAASHLDPKTRYLVSMLCLCHLGPWNTLVSPAQLYCVLADCFPAILKQVGTTFNNAFREEQYELAAIMREETARSLQSKKRGSI